ncbi:sulfotransferase [Pararhodobacter sp. CCB-MM2]|uniref:sulfotransferase n=1 Tax=Pararhodobacter sp. CCB-MM2 TaxID=1786003 RepID=UPI000832F2DD|nr:sulfotransferase [Pararhodobacter sp. CCB-MM2]
MKPHRFNKICPELKGCLFLVTYGRSGSTLLQNVLMTIPGCTIRGENFNALGSIYDTVARARRAKNTWGKTAHDAQHPWFGADAIVAKKLGAGMVDAFFAHVLAPPADARWVGFKEIRYQNMQRQALFGQLDFMRAQFKNAHFVFNTRSAEAVMKSAWWARHDPDEVRALVAKADKNFAEYAEKNPEYSRLVRYEDFTQDSAAFKPIFDMLDEPFDAEAIAKVMNTKLTH